MTLTVGRRLGSYEILSPLGAGGMGVVYRARDSRLGRDVAIKVLTETVVADAARLRRLENEARAASALNHPNIVTVHEIGEADGLVFLVMEFVDGRTLRQRLAAGEGMLALKEALRVSGQIADGLAKAHEGGIVHRDLKPENVMVTPDGLVKILDFGLAKVADPRARDENAPTASEILTRPGTVMGTVGYMSPEQVRGETATAQSDQFSFGCLVFEMLSGRRPFTGASSADTLSAILRDEAPALDSTNPTVPAPLSWIVERCLAKAPRERYHSTADLARDLHTLQEHSGQLSIRRPIAQKAKRSFRRAAAWAAATAVGAVVALAATAWMRPRAEPDFRRLTFRDGLVTRALFMPRSNSILYSASWDGAAVRTFMTLPESSGLDRALDAEPQLPLAYSEDGTQALVLLGQSRASINPQGTLAWWPVLGGKPRRILAGAGWADWAKRRHILAVVRNTGAERALEIHDADGALQRTLFKTTGGVSFVRFSPDEMSVAFIHHPSLFDDGGEVRIARVDATVSRPLAGPFRRCFGLDWNPETDEVWATASRATYSSTLFAIARSGRMRSLQVLPGSYTLHSVAETGGRCLLTSNDARLNLTVRRGRESPRDLSWLGSSLVKDLSPDGRSVLFFDGGVTERASGAWVRPLDGGDAIRLGDGDPGSFSPDGRLVVATTRPLAGPPQIVLYPTEAGQALQVTPSDAEYARPSFSGPRTLICMRSTEGKSEVWRMDVDGSGARSLGAPGCDLPIANPGGTAFLCRGGAEKRSLLVYPMEPGPPGRTLHELPAGQWFVTARWNATGTRILALTEGRRLLQLDSSTGALVAEETLPITGSGTTLTHGAAMSADLEVVAYSQMRSSSSLYVLSAIP